MRNNKRTLHESILDLQYGSNNTPYKIYDTAKDSLSLVQRLSLQKKLPVHSGCVNSICWNDRGDYLLSGSDDQHLCITHGYNYEISTSLQTGHKANIFSARFLPNTSDNHVISCSGDGIIIFSDIQKPESSFSNMFNCHFGTCYKIMTVPNDSHSFLSCGEDKTVRWIDLRMKQSCKKIDCKEDILIKCRSAITTLAINPLTPYHIAVGSADSSVRIFDRRMLGTRATGSYTGSGIQAMVSRFTVPEFEGNAHRITSLAYSPDGSEILVSYSSDYIYLFDVNDDKNSVPKVVKGSKMALGPSSSSGRCKSSEKPSMKRLRVRGDWSDTGPKARPESESTPGREPSSRSLHTSLLERMSDVLTRMFNNTRSSNVNAGASNVQGDVQAALSEADNLSDLNIENTEAREVPLLEAERDLETSEPSPNLTMPSNPDIRGNESTLAKPSTSKESTIGMEEEEDSKETTREELKETASVDQSLENMKKELTTCTKEKGETEPVFNLTFNGHGVQSGVISIDSAAGSSGTPLPTMTEEDSLSSCSQDSNSHANTLKDGESTGGISVPVTNEESFKEGEFSDDSNSSIQIPDNTNAQPEEATTLTEALEFEVPSSSPVRDEEESVLWDDDNTTSDEEDSDPTAAMRNYNLKGVNRNRLGMSSGVSSSDFSGSPNDPAKTSPHGFKNYPSTSDESLSKERSPFSQMSSVPLPRVKRKYTGHRNARTMIKEATFYGNRFIMSGSDCGHIFMWDRDTTELVMILEADHHVVNCLAVHPYDPFFASSGIDYDIKLWSPLREEPFFDEQRAFEIIKRNKVMLEETKDTITVPASFMIRMLASLNHIRSSGNSNSSF